MLFVYVSLVLSGFYLGRGRSSQVLDLISNFLLLSYDFIHTIVILEYTEIEAELLSHFLFPKMVLDHLFAFLIVSFDPLAFLVSNAGACTSYAQTVRYLADVIN